MCLQIPRTLVQECTNGRKVGEVQAPIRLWLLILTCTWALPFQTPCSNNSRTNQGEGPKALMQTQEGKLAWRWMEDSSSISSSCWFRYLMRGKSTMEFKTNFERRQVVRWSLVGLCGFMIELRSQCGKPKW